MELRVLNYFLTVAREGGLTGASEVLHVTQPTMSRQIQELEEELGQRLFIRTTRSMVLTPEGMLLRKRAEEILEMAEKTKAEFSAMGSAVAGDVFIGSGETFALKQVTDLMTGIREDHPDIHFQIYSGNAEDVLERLEKGLLDFGVLVEPVDVSRYNSLCLPAKDTWGLILRRDHPLAERETIRREDLAGVPLIVSRQTAGAQSRNNDYLAWFGGSYDSLNIVGGYSLMYNGALMVKSGIGCAVGLNGIVNTTETSDLCFRSFDPPLEAGIVVIWKKYQVFSKPAELLLERMMAVFGEFPIRKG
jgi:DNA-binding transcriptional LysR family regulator